MGYRNLRQCVDDLQKTRQLVRIDEEIDADLEAAEVQRRVYAAGGPAIFFANVRHCSFPMVSNLFGTMDRARYIFRDAIHGVEALIALKKSPPAVLKTPWKLPEILRTLVSMRPALRRSGPVMECRTTIDQLPQLRSWPMDAGAFITLPQVYSEHPDQPGYFRSNLGMYRIQLSGNRYQINEQIGLHYQIHRSIAGHHAAALKRGESLPVNIFVGGPPAMTLSAVMPLPDGIPEVAFAGALSRRAIRMVRQASGPLVCAEADFCISGTISDEQMPEGPFGDHLGYYSLAHDFPVLNVNKVRHRRDAVWPFTVVGRPPQEDTVFGELIHELTGPAIPAVLPGVKAVHAVDASGVHPLLLAVGSERYVPWAKTTDRYPQELLTLANAILGQGQLSLAKYLLIAAEGDDPQPDIHDIRSFLMHVLKRVDLTRDLHFQTRTTIDTLDYTGSGLNRGSKLVIAAAGPERRQLATHLPPDLKLPDRFRDPIVCLPGVLAVTAPQWSAEAHGTDPAVAEFCEAMEPADGLDEFPLIVLADDSQFCAESLNNLLWVTFTRSNPASDISGIRAFHQDKHWGCRGSLVIDARIKAHMAPPLIPDPQVSARVDRLFRRSGPLHGIASQR
ncbi:MAG: UbiD family decarboxylase [Fuerstiella sp.]|nr:UbiD family decarboxylase [Fuerstiella sp.]